MNGPILLEPKSSTAEYPTTEVSNNRIASSPCPMPPQPITPSGRPVLPIGETSYIENILRLNIGEPGIFHFSFTHTLGEALNTRNITGSVEEAGRDHVIIKEAATGHQFLFPMIYFDYAEFLGQVKYFHNQIINVKFEKSSACHLWLAEDFLVRKFSSCNDEHNPAHDECNAANWRNCTEYANAREAQYVQATGEDDNSREK